jgi:hypothetical protein
MTFTLSRRISPHMCVVPFPPSPDSHRSSTVQFVYPFTLETHVLSLQPSPHEAIAQRRARNAQILHQREVEEEQRE